MIRAIALAATLGALTAAAAVYTFTAPRPQTNLAATVDDGPICTTMGSLADSADWAQLDPDFAAGKKAMAAGDWNAAIAALKPTFPRFGRVVGPGSRLRASWAR